MGPLSGLAIVNLLTAGILGQKNRVGSTCNLAC